MTTTIRDRCQSMFIQLRASTWLSVALRAVGAAGAVTALAALGSAFSPLGTGPAQEIDLTQVSAAAHSSGGISLTAASIAEPPHKAPEPAESDQKIASDGCTGDERGPGCGSAVDDQGRVVLNEASEQELTTLPGVGPSRARQIIALRERLGGYRRLEQLLRVRGIGPRTLAKLRPRIVLDRPKPT